MSNRALNWAWDCQLKAGKKILLLALADMADENDSCFPGQRRLAEMTGCSEDTVMRGLRELEALGLLTRQRRTVTGGFRTSDRFMLHVGAQPNSQSEPNPQIAGTAERASLTRNLRQPNPQIAGAKVNHPVNPKKETPNGVSKKGTRLPAGWLPSDATVETIRQERPGLDLDIEHKNFADYWASVPGQRGLKLDWDATWRYWMRRARQVSPRAVVDQNLANFQRAWGGDGAA